MKLLYEIRQALLFYQQHVAGLATHVERFSKEPPPLNELITDGGQLAATAIASLKDFDPVTIGGRIDAMERDLVALVKVCNEDQMYVAGVKAQKALAALGAARDLVGGDLLDADWPIEDDDDE